MKHNKDVSIRILYFIFLFIIYRIIFIKLGLSLNLAMYGMFVILMFLYYLFDVLSFNKKYRKRNFIYSFILNFIIYLIFYFFYHSNLVVTAFTLFTCLQAITDELFYKTFKKKNTVIIGEGFDIDVIKKVFTKSGEYEFLGYLDDKNDGKRKYIGRIEELPMLIKEKNIEEIIFTRNNHVKRCADILLEEKIKGIKIIDYLSFLEAEEGKIDVDKINSFWVLMSNGFDTFHGTFQKKLKRGFDLGVSIFLFACFIPFIVITYILVKCDIGIKYLFVDPKKLLKNPAFFKQKRIGYKGKEFEIIKFRSMKVHDPEKYSKYASEHDERITKVGHFIRKTRLDELPQIINVIKGDMSFVGPRPEWNELGRDYEKKIKNYHLRYAVRPGVTGWAQTMYSYGASLEDAKVKLEYDLYYIKNQSLILDLMILFKTSKVIIFRKGM